MRLRHFFLVGSAVSALATGLLAGPAGAAGTPSPCNASPVFAPWGDTSGYVKMSAVGTGWGWQTGSRVLHLAGTARQSFSASCLAFMQPKVRLFAFNAGSPTGSLSVSVQYRDTAGVSHDVTIGSVTGTASWQPSAAFSFDSSKLSGNVQVTLTASGAGADWYVGGVFIDPFCAR